jgi:hypothetical protein
VPWLRSRNDRDQLHAAAEADAPTDVEVLLRRGADVGARDAQGRTPLHLAALQGSVRCTQLLLGHGAAVDARTQDGVTALTAAVQAWPARPELVDLLRADGANPWAADTIGRTPRAWAGIAVAGDSMPDLRPAEPAWTAHPSLTGSDPLRPDELAAVAGAVEAVTAHDVDALRRMGQDDVEQLYVWTRDFGPYPRVHLRPHIGRPDQWDLAAHRHAGDGSSSVDVWMWTIEEGPSDLVLSLRLEADGAGVRTTLEDLRVM